MHSTKFSKVPDKISLEFSSTSNPGRDNIIPAGIAEVPTLLLLSIRDPGLLLLEEEIGMNDDELGTFDREIGAGGRV
jgi:hypothetical protein